MGIANQKWLLNRGMHLGFVKETFAAGTVIEKIDNKLVIDGKPYETTKDLDILIRHNWAEPYSDARKEQLTAQLAVKKVIPKIRPEEEEIVKKTRNMEVIESDQDLNEDIDISHTKKQPKPKPDKNAPLEVIRGDESPEERIARLTTQVPKMPIVADDSLGELVGESSPSLNAGTIKTVSAEQLKIKAAEIAAKKKAEVAQKRAVTVTEDTIQVQTTDQAATEIATGESGEIDAGFENVASSVPPAQSAPRTITASDSQEKRRGRPPGAKNKPKAPEAIA